MFNAALAFGMPGGIEWVIIGVVALLIFGRRLPEIMRGVGSSVREFRKGIDTDEPAQQLPPQQQAPQQQAPPQQQAAPAEEAKKEA